MQQEEEQLRCPKHGKKLYYFCEEDGEFLCVVCCNSKVHKSHKYSRIKEAAKHHQERIHSEFECLRQILKDEENFLLSSIERLEEEGTKEGEHYNAATQAQLSSLKALIDSLKAKQQMLPRELLQDIKGTLQRSEVVQSQFQSKTPIPLDLQKQLKKVKSRNDCIIRSLRKCGDEIQDDRKKDQSKFLQDARTTHKQNAPVTFDEASAHIGLNISKDLKTVTVSMIPQKHSEEPAEPQRFYPSRCVLGSPGFSTGRHTWEVELSGPIGRACILGVAWEQVPRKGNLAMEPASGFWVLQITSAVCQALTERNSWKTLCFCPKRVSVCLDLEGEEVTFYDAATKDHIYTFHTSFPGKIFPFFMLLFSGSQISVSP
ncbi:E3 ubiquitin-protein ligase TRIM31-like [Ochotona curzoniae]|uniref:E3 ubiquitin-protein ligase TRIM31-like n=1 Tax=Ochotona curzoniae TaxID=130825 RepID=UPI001B3511DF|nr:E3 ubiquitin-protein ligase TRIM31-like [Ochotona curzoniae]